MEAFFLLAVFFIAPVAVLAGGWLLFTAAFCLKAIATGQPVKPVLTEMLNEW